MTPSVHQLVEMMGVEPIDLPQCECGALPAMLHPHSNHYFLDCRLTETGASLDVPRTFKIIFPANFQMNLDLYTEFRLT